MVAIKLEIQDFNNYIQILSHQKQYVELLKLYMQKYLESLNIFRTNIANLDEFLSGMNEIQNLAYKNIEFE